MDKIIGKRRTTLIQQVYVPPELSERFTQQAEFEFDLSGLDTLNDGIEVPYDDFVAWVPADAELEDFVARVVKEANDGIEIDGFLFTLPEDDNDEA